MDSGACKSGGAYVRRYCVIIARATTVVVVFSFQLLSVNNANITVKLSTCKVFSFRHQNNRIHTLIITQNIVRVCNNIECTISTHFFFVGFLALGFLIVLTVTAPVGLASSSTSKHAGGGSNLGCAGKQRQCRESEHQEN